MPKPQPAPRSMLSTLADVFPVGKGGQKLLSEYAVFLFVGFPPPKRNVCVLTSEQRVVHLN